jgi:curli biogenesis system outer membrane secretion channel CsgG
MKRVLIPALMLLASLAGGCGDFAWFASKESDYVKPAVAVTKFDSRVSAPNGWDLGGGLADVLVDRLMATHRFHVMERKEMDAVVRELKLQNSGATRDQQKLAVGKLKNVQYLVRGVVTDFGIVKGGDGFLSGGWSLFGGGNKAVMAITLVVVDVESGEIICSESLEESVSTSDVDMNASYKGVGFGGSTFNRTSMGKATVAVIDRAVKRVIAAIACQPWAPRIAHIQEDSAVLINGGRDHAVKVGQEFEVVETGAPILNPDTGDVLTHTAGKLIGRLRVTQVQDHYCVADVISGKLADIKVGQNCRRPQ